MWVRGLKHHNGTLSIKIKVAPYVGAWIETFYIKYGLTNKVVAPYVGAWIETATSRQRRSSHVRRTLCGCVD